MGRAGRERARLVADFENIPCVGHGWMRLMSFEPAWVCLVIGICF